MKINTIKRILLWIMVIVISFVPLIICNTTLSDEPKLNQSTQRLPIASIESVSMYSTTSSMIESKHKERQTEIHAMEEYIEIAISDVAESVVKEITEEKDNSTIAYASTEVISIYNGYITKYMDLQNRIDITTDQMNFIINYWLNINGGDSILEGLGQAFIDASKVTGYDPIFLLALCALESGWQPNKLHIDKSNPYSINMTDINPYGGYIFGDNFYDGIVNGAVWIWDNYYMQGQTTLYDMIYGYKMYCSNGDHWISSIVNIMDESYRLIR